MDSQIPTLSNTVQTQQTPVGSLVSSGNSAPSPLSSNEIPENKKGLLFVILFVIIVLILLLGTLNYINILNLSEIFPNYLGFLPHKPYEQDSNEAMKQSNNITTTVPTLSPSPLKLSCPSIKEFCERGQGVVKDVAYVGIGYKLSSESAIFAAFDGNLTATFSGSTIEVNGKTTQGRFKALYLDSPGLNLRGVYYFRGQVTKTGPVIKGEQIAISNGIPIEVYNGNSLIFSLIPGYPGLNTPTILNKEDFE